GGVFRPRPHRVFGLHAAAQVARAIALHRGTNAGAAQSRRLCRRARASQYRAQPMAEDVRRKAPQPPINPARRELAALKTRQARCPIAAGGAVAERLRKGPRKVFQPGSIPGRASNSKGTERSSARPFCFSSTDNPPAALHIATDSGLSTPRARAFASA